MTVRFKSEYQKSFGAIRSKRTSDQCCPPLAGLRSDHMGVSREPRLQRRRRPGPAGQARSCSPLLHTPAAPRTAPPAVSQKQPDPEPPTPPGSPAEPDAARRSEEAAEDAEAAAGGKSAKPRPSQPRSQSQPSRPVTSSALEREAPNERDSELRARGQRSGGQRSEYHRQFSWKTPAGAASPILTAEQVLYSSSRSIPPFKKNPLPQETEYQRSFQGLVPPVGTRLRRHLEHRRTPLFHTQLQRNRKRREESQKKPRPQPSGHQREDTRSPLKATPPPPPPPPQAHRGHRMSTEYQSSFRSPLCRNPQGGGATEGDAHQMVALRQQAQSYRQRAWGTNFSREHLSQLLSEHNGLWEPNDTPTAPPTPPSPPSPPSLEALDLASSSRESSPVGPGGPRKTRKTPPGPPPERRSAWGAEDDDAEE